MALSSRQEMCLEEIKNAPHPASDDRRDADTNSKPSFAFGGAPGDTKCDRDSLRCRRCYKQRNYTFSFQCWWCPRWQNVRIVRVTTQLLLPLLCLRLLIIIRNLPLTLVYHEVTVTRKPVDIVCSTATYWPTGSKGMSGKGTQDDATYPDTSSNMIIP